MFFFFLVVAFLIPLAVYCLILAMMNRRSTPVMVSGILDSLGLLFAASGFLLVVVPALLITMYYKALGLIPLDLASFRDALDEVWRQWWGITLAYYLLLLAGTTLFLLARRNKTVIYNVNPDSFRRILVHTLQRLGLQPAGSEETLRTDGIMAIQPLAENSPGPSVSNVVAVEVFPAFANITLHWRHLDKQLRCAMEEDLRKNLDAARLVGNPVGTWLLGISGVLFGLIFLVIFVMVLQIYFPVRRG